MTGWTIDNTTHYQSFANHYSGGKRWHYTIDHSASGRHWISKVRGEDGSELILDASEVSEVGAKARCEMHAATF